MLVTAGVTALATVAFLVLRFTPAGSKRPAEFSHLLIISAILLVGVALAAMAYARGRPALALAGLVGAAALGLTVFSARQTLWDNDQPFAEVARRARELPGNYRLAGWGKVNGSTVYYYGRDIPHARHVKDCLSRRYPPLVAETRWSLWLADPNLIIVAESDYADDIAPAGFRPLGVDVGHCPAVIHPPDLYSAKKQSR